MVSGCIKKGFTMRGAQSAVSSSLKPQAIDHHVARAQATGGLRAVQGLTVQRFEITVESKDIQNNLS
jgi:hypothetical protein